MSTILIIEDDPSMRKFITDMLTIEHYHCVPAENGSVAQKIIRDNKTINLVITDLIMPDGDGIETIMFLKKEVPSIPIIAISGGARNGPESYLPIAETLGAAFVFEKPFDRREFLAAIHTCLSKKIE